MKNKKKLNIVKVILLIILIILLFLVLSGKIAFSKYKRTVISDGVAKIAAPVFCLNGVENITFNGNETKTQYNFSVCNYDENDNISDVEMLYYIEIENKSDANLTFTLYDSNNNKVTLTNNKTANIALNRDIKDIDNYILEINYVSDDNILEDIEGNIQIKVEAVQVQGVI